MPIPRTFRSLRNYNYRLFWCGQIISLVGTWMQTIGQSWLVLELTHSPLALGTVTALQFLPILALSLFAGVLVDRYPKRWLILGTQSVSLLQALALAILISTGRVELWHVYVLALSLGLVNAFDMPSRQAFSIEMVGREDLTNAVALNSTVFNGARIVGPAVGGVLIASVGLADCFYLNAASFIGPILALLLMRQAQLRPPVRRPSAAVLRDLVEGLSFAMRTPMVMLVMILMGVLGLFGYNFMVVLPLLASNALHVDAAGFGLLTSAMGVGSLVAALAIATVTNISRRVLVLGAAGFTLVLGAVALSSSYPLSIGLLVLLGAASIIFTTTANSSLQLNTPDRLRGRVLSLYTLLFAGSTPIGGMLTGWLADRWGIQVALGIEAAICAAGVLAAIAYHLAVGRKVTPEDATGRSSAQLAASPATNDR